MVSSRTGPSVSAMTRASSAERWSVAGAASASGGLKWEHGRKRWRQASGR